MASQGNLLTDVYTASWYNSVEDRLKGPRGGRRLPDDRQFDHITVVNHSSSPYPRWYPVSVGDPVLDYTAGMREDLIFYTKDYDVLDPDNLAILLDPLPENGSARALVSGRAWCILPSEPPATRRFLRLNSLGQFHFSKTGRIEILKSFAIPGAGTATPSQYGFQLAGPAGAFRPVMIGPTVLQGSTGSGFSLIGPSGAFPGLALGPFTLAAYGSLHIGLAIIGPRVNYFDVRVNDEFTKFEKTFDGINWITWAELSDCEEDPASS